MDSNPEQCFFYRKRSTAKSGKVCNVDEAVADSSDVDTGSSEERVQLDFLQLSSHSKIVASHQIRSLLRQQNAIQTKLT